MQVQLQVSLGVAQEVGGGGGEGGAALGSDDGSGMAMKGGDYGMLDWVREGRSEAGEWGGGLDRRPPSVIVLLGVFPHVWRKRCDRRREERMQSLSHNTHTLARSTWGMSGVISAGL